MRNVNLTEFKKMLVSDIKEGGSFNLMADGQLLAIVAIPISADKKTQIQAICSQMNLATGKEG